MNNEELHEKFGVTSDQLNARADEYESNDWSHMSFGETTPGRPRLTDELDASAMATATVAISLSEDLAARYDRLAKETGRTKTFLMAKALEESIDRLEYEFSILKDIEDYRAGRLETYSLDEVREMLGLDD